MKRTVESVFAVAITVAIFGFFPFASFRDTTGTLADGHSGFETGVHRQPNGVYRVRALTRMPNMKAEVIRWWRFAIDLMTHAIEEILSNANAIGVSAPLASYG